MDQAKKPWYPWYPRDFAMDGPVIQMDLAAEGAYHRLLDYQWLHGSIPADTKAQAAICKNIPLKTMTHLWVQLEPCFQPLAGEPGKLINQRLERVRLEAEEKHQERSASGKKGAEARRRKKVEAMVATGSADSSANSSANPELLATAQQPQADSTATATSTVTGTSTPSPTTQPPDAGGEPDAVAIRATAALNQGMRANPRIPQTTLRAVHHAEQVALVREWLEEGLLPAAIVQGAREMGESYRPKGHGNRQLWGLKYCEGRIRELDSELRQTQAAGAPAFVEA